MTRAEMHAAHLSRLRATWQQALRRMPAWNPKRLRRSIYMPHQSDREMARRVRQNYSLIGGNP
jgi:hypothetical protein